MDNILKLVPINKRNCFILNADYNHKGTVVKRGFITDLDSIPKVPIVYSIFKGRAKTSAVIHDWHYFQQDVSRLRADRIFLVQMIKEEGINRTTARLMYTAVRIGGGVTWNRNKRLKEQYTQEERLARLHKHYAKALVGVNW